MTASEGRVIHGRAEQERERGNFFEALKLTDEALLLYQEANDDFGFCDVLGSRVLSLLHLYGKTEDKKYLILAKHTGASAVEVSEQSSDPSAKMMPYMNLGRVFDKLEDFSESSKNYEKAVAAFIANPPKEHNRPAVLLDMKIHMEVSKYRSGDKSALSRLDGLIFDLENTKDEERYNKDVWLSGAHMKLAEILKLDDLEKAREHLDSAKQIIDANPDLKLRAEQWEKLSKNF